MKATVMQQPQDQTDSPQAAYNCGFLLGKIFSTCRDDQRETMLEEVVAKLGDTTVRFSGHELNQYDLNIWLAIFNHPSIDFIDDYRTFTPESILNELKMPVNPESMQMLHTSLIRMVACCIEIESQLYDAGPIIINLSQNPDTNEYTARLNKKITRMIMA